MKILLLAPEFHPIKGGVGTYINELLKNMPNDVEVHVFASKINDDETSDPQKIEHMGKILDKVTIHPNGPVVDTFTDNLWFQISCFQKGPRQILSHE